MVPVPRIVNKVTVVGIIIITTLVRGTGSNGVVET